MAKVSFRSKLIDFPENLKRPFKINKQVDYQAPSEARGVVIGGKKHEESWCISLIDSEMAGPISLKLSGIDPGNSVTVLGQKN